ncbi:hypothetical protein [Leeuwenhoekiella sp. H156]|uniref:hypothetical protein n=1 Tax=Leeuwenhoekiella sp. H156 TaxID=3450128 RepID=UPI003FA49B77
MIKVSDICVHNQDSTGSISATVDVNGKLKTLYFETNFSLKMTSEIDISNTLLIGLLPLSFEKQCDIYIEGSIDEKLRKEIVNELFPVMQQVYKISQLPQISFLKNESVNSVSSAGVATGLSCGVDSFATINQMRSELTHLTFFDAGSHGKGSYSQAALIRNHRYNNVKKAADELQLPLLTVNTNLSDFTSAKFQDNHAFLQISCAHLLSGLINTYYYSSGQNDDYLSKHPLDFIYLNNFMVHHLSSYRLKVIASLTKWGRIERTKMVSVMKTAHMHLDVCVDTETAMQNGLINCSKCHKCMRTQLTLQLLNEYEEFDHVFDSKVFESERDKFIAYLILTKREDVLNAELFDLVKELDGIEFKVYYLLMHLKWAKLKKKIKRMLVA